MSELEPLKSDTTEVVETLKSDIAALRLRLRDAKLDDSLPSQRAKFEAAVAALLQPAAVVVREAGPGDTEGVVRCLEAFHTEHAAEVEEGGGTGEAFDRADYARWLPCGSNEAEDALSFTFVAAGPAAGEVRGVLLLCADSTLHELPAVGQHWDISELYVSPQARGEGLGGRLLDYAAAWCAHDGRFAFLEASSARANERASRFYVAHGFEVAAREVTFSDRTVRGHGAYTVHLLDVAAKQAALYAPWEVVEQGRAHAGAFLDKE